VLQIKKVEAQCDKLAIEFDNASRRKSPIEPTVMLFEMLTGMGPRNRVLDGVQIPMRKGNVEGVEGSAHCKI